MVKKAAVNGYNAIQANAMALPFPDNSFSFAVVVTGVLNHLSDDDSVKVLQECRRVVAKGGVIIGACFDYTRYHDVLKRYIFKPEENIIYKQRLIEFCLSDQKFSEDYRVPGEELKANINRSLHKLLANANKYNIDPSTIMACIPDKDYARSYEQLDNLFKQAGFCQRLQIIDMENDSIVVFRAQNL